MNLNRAARGDRQIAPHALSRRDFLGSGAMLLGAAWLEASLLRASQARGESWRYSGREQLFDLEQVAAGVYAALARPQALINSNAAIFVNSRDLLIVDAHSKPSAVAALVAQVRREVTRLPVRYVVNSHFHWDHMQGNSGYRQQFPEVRFIASTATRRLMSDNSAARLQSSLTDISRQIEQQRDNLAKASVPQARAFYQGQIAQLEAYQREMKQFSLELPDITLGDALVIHDRAHTLQLGFHGRAHTAGDVTVFCPEKRVIATGDMLHGFLPFIADGYPREWPRTLDQVASLDFTQVIPGHGPVHHDRVRLDHMRRYIEELTERVARGREAGRQLQQLQQEISPSSLRSLATDNYSDLVLAALRQFTPWYGTPPALDQPVRANVAEVFRRLESP